ncbi:MAG: N-6 DNA methylase [Thermoplasmataceae archaeon]|jgi:type I restriction-modification system DNA methylase subunit
MAEAKKTKEDYNIDFDKIRELISDYEEIKKSGEIKHKNETETRESFISPLFKALGWNTENRLKSNDSVSKEENIAGKRSDYGFRINGIPKFFLEAKSLKEENIEHNSKYVTQAIDYAWMKSCSLAILCNFETIAVYNADWKDSNYWNNILFVFHPSDFLTNPHFKMLSKESFEKNELDTYAKENYKKQLKYRIDKQLLQDMIHFREILSKDIVKNNQDKHLTQDDIDESVQRILDRLIFIRNAEDRGLEENQLQSIVRQWYSKGKGHLMKEISRIYADYDRNYNSKLFAHHLCDDLYMDNEALQEVIEGLNHSKDNSYRYDFSIIESDVLGNIYEQYLGNILKSTPKRAKLEESKTHRKEQGIYYTPSYIVDYIVKNTVGEYIKTHTPEEIKKVRILDPACGSGSFLIRAYKELENYWRNNSDFAQLTLDSEEFYSKKVEILRNNIFGVDLDSKAVEIAQLNLLLQISERKQRLPILQNNIKVGNSLIDDPTVSDRAFKWEQEFPGIMKEGGFDIVIGNPPYVDIKHLDPNIVKHFFTIYTTTENRMNIYSTFVERTLSLQKNRGYFGFIIPNSILYNESYKKIRTLLLNQTILTKIIRLPDDVFEGVKIETIILIYKKCKERSKTKECEVYLYPRDAKIDSINKDNCLNIMHFNQNVWELGNHIINLSANSISNAILKKIEGNNTKSLVDICDFSLGLTPYDKYKGHSEQQIKNRVFHSDTKNDETFRPLLSGEDIIRYGIFWNRKEYISYGNWLGAPREKRFFASPHIVVRQIISGKPPRIYAGYTDEELYNTQIGFNLISKNENEFKIKYILALLNSKLMSYYHKEKYLDPTKTLFQKILIVNAKKFPIKIISMSEQNKIIELVDKIIKLNKQLNQLNNKKTDESNRIIDEISKIDSQLDIIIYKIYGVTKEEKKTIEEVLK